MIATCADVIAAAPAVSTLASDAVGPALTLTRVGPDEAERSSEVLVGAYASAGIPEFDDDQEIGRFWGSTYGPPVPEATWCARRVDDGTIVGLSLLCLFEGLPLVAHLVVDESVRRRGVGTVLLAASARGLLDVGIDTIELAVDLTNHPARDLYVRMGFRDIDRPAPTETPAAEPGAGTS